MNMLCTCMSAKAKAGQEASGHLLDVTDEVEEDNVSGVRDFIKIAVLGSSAVGKTCKLAEPFVIDDKCHT